jgi:hypothetical protein
MANLPSDFDYDGAIDGALCRMEKKPQLPMIQMHRPVRSRTRPIREHLEDERSIRGHVIARPGLGGDPRARREERLGSPFQGIIDHAEVQLHAVDSAVDGRVAKRSRAPGIFDQIGVAHPSNLTHALKDGFQIKILSSDPRDKVCSGPALAVLRRLSSAAISAAGPPSTLRRTVVARAPVPAQQMARVHELAILPERVARLCYLIVVVGVAYLRGIN